MVSCLTRGSEDLERWHRNEQDMESCKSAVRKVEVILQGYAERFAETGRRISKLESQVDLLSKEFRKMTVLGQSVAKMEGRLVNGEAEIAKVAKQQASSPLGGTKVQVESLETRLQGLEVELLESVRHVSELVSRENSRAIVFDSTLASRENSQLPVQADYAISGGIPKFKSEAQVEGDPLVGLKPKQKDSIPEGNLKLERDPLADLESKLQVLSTSDMPGDYRRDTPPKSKDETLSGQPCKQWQLPVGVVSVGGNNLSKDETLSGQPAASPLPSSLINKGLTPRKQDSRVSPVQTVVRPLPAPSNDECIPPKHNSHLVASLQEQFPDHQAHDGFLVDVSDLEIAPLPPSKKTPSQRDNAANGDWPSAAPDSEKTASAVSDDEGQQSAQKAGSKKGWKFVPKWLRR